MTCKWLLYIIQKKKKKSLLKNLRKNTETFLLFVCSSTGKKKKKNQENKVHLGLTLIYNIIHFVIVLSSGKWFVCKSKHGYDLKLNCNVTIADSISA